MLLLKEQILEDKTVMLTVSGREEFDMLEEKLFRYFTTYLRHSILSICNIYLFPVLVLRAGFAFRLLQFLFIAFLLLLLILSYNLPNGFKAGLAN